MLTCKIDQLILQSANCTVSRVAFMIQVQIEGWGSNIQQIESPRRETFLVSSLDGFAWWPALCPSPRALLASKFICSANFSRESVA